MYPPGGARVTLAVGASLLNSGISEDSGDESRQSQPRMAVGDANFRSHTTTGTMVTGRVLTVLNVKCSRSSTTKLSVSSTTSTSTLLPGVEKKSAFGQIGRRCRCRLGLQFAPTATLF